VGGERGRDDLRNDKERTVKRRMLYKLRNEVKRKFVDGEWRKYGGRKGRGSAGE